LLRFPIHLNVLAAASATTTLQIVSVVPRRHSCQCHRDIHYCLLLTHTNTYTKKRTLHTRVTHMYAKKKKVYTALRSSASLAALASGRGTRLRTFVGLLTEGSETAGLHCCTALVLIGWTELTARLPVLLWIGLLLLRGL
jgi:hypothetical protein